MNRRLNCVGCARLFLAVSVLAAAGMGCQTVRYGGAPEPSFDVDKDLKDLASHYSESVTVTQFYANASKEKRNEFISGRLVMMNIRYIQFVRTTTSEKQLLDSAVDILALSLNLAGASVGSAETKTILAAVAAGVMGSKTVVDKNFYYEKTVPALVAAMNAERKKILATILNGMDEPLDKYSFDKALTDLHDYYFAGTYLGAIQAIHIDSGEKETKQNDIINDIKKRATLSSLSKETIDLKGSMTDAIYKLKDADLERVNKTLGLLGEREKAASLDDAKKKLQSYVREARATNTIDNVAAAFRNGQLIQ